MDAQRLDCAHDEIVAVLPSDDDAVRSGDVVTVLLRTADGRLELRQLPRPEPSDDAAPALAVVRRGKPIVDPMTRQVVGYEMETGPAAN
jgi:hypothetical protein